MKMDSINKRDSEENIRHAYFAGGCFWCTEHDLKQVTGVKDVISGYAGGDFPDPTYEEVCSGKTGHREAVLVIYDTEKIRFSKLIDAFLKTVDPLDPGGQFFDRGLQYTNAVFYQDDDERKTAVKSIKNAAKELGVDKLSVAILPYKNFYPAEEYHQNFSEKNPERYCSYRKNSGRDNKLKLIWR